MIYMLSFVLTSGLIKWNMVSKVTDVPYGDHFEHHESWTIMSTTNTAIKCIVRPTDKVKMIKSTFFESRIRSRSKVEFIEYFAKWMAAVKERGFLTQKEEPLKILVPNQMESSSAVKRPSRFEKRHTQLVDERNPRDAILKPTSDKNGL